MSVDIRNAQVKNLKVGPTIITEGLVSWWNAASVHSYPRTGSIWYDLIKQNHNDGSMVNMSADNFTDDGGGALTFDGTDEYVSIPDDASLNPDSFTLFLWFKPEAISKSNNYLIGKRGKLVNSNAAGWAINISITSTTWSPDNMSLTDGTNSASMSGGLTVPITGWDAISFTYDSVSRLMVLRVLSANLVTVGAVPSGFGSISNSVPLEMLATSYYNRYSVPSTYDACSASIANVAIYNRVLTDGEIDELYTSTRSRFDAE